MSAQGGLRESNCCDAGEEELFREQMMLDHRSGTMSEILLKKTRVR